MFAVDSLVLDLILSAEAPPAPEALLEGIGGEDVARTRTIVDPDLDAPQYEMVSPSVPLRQQDELRLLIVDETVAPMRQSPRTDPIVPRDLRTEKERLVRIVEM